MPQCSHEYINNYWEGRSNKNSILIEFVRSQSECSAGQSRGLGAALHVRVRVGAQSHGAGTLWHGVGCEAWVLGCAHRSREQCAAGRLWPRWHLWPGAFGLGRLGAPGLPGCLAKPALGWALHFFLIYLI